MAQWQLCNRWHVALVLSMLLSSAPVSTYAESGDEEAAATLKLSLSECIQRALEHHPSVQEVKWEVAIRESDLMQARGGNYPTAEFANFVGVVNDVKGNVNNFKQYGVTERLGPFTRLEGQIVYPLFTWGKITNGIKAAAKGVEQEHANVEQKQAEAIREVKEFYYTLLYTKQIEDLLGEVRDGFGKAVTAADERLQKGEVSQIDVLNLKIGYAGVAKEVGKLENGIELTRAALLRVMGLPLDTRFEPTDTRLTPQSAHLKELEYYVQRLFTNRPEWKRLRIGIQAKEAELEMATSDYFPSFFLAIPIRYGYAPGRSRQTNPFAYDDFNFGSAGPIVGLHWNFNIGETRAKVAKSRAELMKLHAQEKTAITGFPLEVKEAYLNVKEAESRIKITDDGRKAGRALVALSAANFELGIGEPQDIFLGLGNYTRAANDYYEAVKDYNVALAKLSFIVGEEVSELHY
ncbi:MAG: TolC family protein [Candidatus Binatia bacterium]